MAMKHCSKCFEVLPENKKNFVSNKNRKSGLESQCKGCRRDYKQKRKEKDNSLYRKWRRKNEEEIKEYERIYREQNKEKIAEYNFLYYRENKEKIKKRYAKYYQQNKKRYRKQHAKYAKENPELFRRYRQERKHRIKSLKYTLTKSQWECTLKNFNHQCAYCGSTESLEQEHVIPVSRGGHYTPDNIIPACRSCNASKNNKIMQDWFTQHENYSVERMANILKYVQKNKAEVNI